jgi:predicted nucleic acid-binding protein
MDRLYLDYNCFQRSFDDPSQTRILMEALACQDLFARAERGEVELVWSFMHADETALCPFLHRRVEALRLADACLVRVGPDGEAVERAKQLQTEAGVSPKDALHLACAVAARATTFLTCDDRLVRQAQRAPTGLEIMNPVDYWRREYT